MPTSRRRCRCSGLRPARVSRWRRDHHRRRRPAMTPQTSVPRSSAARCCEASATGSCRRSPVVTGPTIARSTPGSIAESASRASTAPRSSSSSDPWSCSSAGSPGGADARNVWGVTRFSPPDASRAPRYTGIRTFARLPHVTLPHEGVDAAVIGIPFDTATSFRSGARFGPEAIRSASALLRPYHPALDVNVVETLSIVDYGDVPVSPGDTERTYGQIEQGLAPLVEAGVFPLALGGDHSVTLAELRVLARKHGPLALLQLDAHGDTWDEYFGQRYFHGTTFLRAFE